MEEKKSNIFLPILIIVVLLAAGYFLFGDKLMKKGGETALAPTAGDAADAAGGSQARGETVPATGSVDDAVEAILFDAANDPAFGEGEDAEAALVESDGDAITGLGDAYDVTGI